MKIPDEIIFEIFRLYEEIKKLKKQQARKWNNDEIRDGYQKLIETLENQAVFLELNGGY